MPRRPPTIFLAPRIFSRGEDASLRRAFKAVGWTETPDAASADIVWDVWLSDAEVDQHAALMPGQVVNRFPAMAECCRKAVFATLLSRLRRLLPVDAPLNDGSLIPVQFSLPREFEALRHHVELASAAAAQRGLPHPCYIVKPDIGSRRRHPAHRRPGAHVPPRGAGALVQEYLAQPMLIDGLKFDLRLYVLVADSHSSSEDESLVRFFLYREGLARFAVEAYEPPDDHNLANVHMHLTNYSLNKKAAGFKHCDDADGGNGSKRSVSSVFQQLERSGRIDSADALWAQIEALTARTLGVIYPVSLGHAAAGRTSASRSWAWMSSSTCTGSRG